LPADPLKGRERPAQDEHSLDLPKASTRKIQKFRLREMAREM
jgi:hypothetical protein